MKRLLLTTLASCTLALGIEAQGLQKVIIEEHTGAWCGWCPDGALVLNDVLAAHPNAIGVAMHQGDAMQTPASGPVRSFYNPAFPQATFNRSGAPVSRTSWASAVTPALEADPLVTVAFDSVAFNTATRDLTVRIKATFLRDTSGQMRFNVYLLEDHLVGSGTGWDQVNYNNSTAGHPLQGQGNPILGWEHNHVLRDACGGAWGTAGIIPSVVTAGQEFTHTYTYHFPNAWNENNMHLVAMVNYMGGQAIYQRPTLNGEEMPLSLAIGVDEGLTPASEVMQVWPNPASGKVNVNFTVEEMGDVRVEVLNGIGQHVATLLDGFANSGVHTVYWQGNTLSGTPAPNGIYYVRLVTAEGQTLSKKIVLQR